MPHDNPDMTVDFFDLETFAVFSERVCNALRQIMPIKNLQLIEATIKEYEEEYENFRVAHIHGIREIRSFDEKLSKYEEIDEDGGWWGIEKIVLDRERLSQIPLEDRLIFLATEFTSLKLYHKSVIDAIMSVNPRGMKVTKVEDWIL
jgi:hypothetical protein